MTDNVKTSVMLFPKRTFVALTNEAELSAASTSPGGFREGLLLDEDQGAGQYWCYGQRGESFDRRTRRSREADDGSSVSIH